MRRIALAFEEGQIEVAGGFLPDATVEVGRIQPFGKDEHGEGLMPHLVVAAATGDPLAEAIRDQVLGRGHADLAVTYGDENLAGA
ncbi:hypothetical protein M0638_21895 [Roseomonas sp. NAR14]|uniref:Uncharacterized protein n=1 Tax=Roseomonas acroporae TaxID=2937791 RepID=A0A9X2BXB5_9PROT|nr:hypothetical protein [Roseomonas acroporae]MCK8787031.1 hypothetical protein [Roseomonas acroporae]